MQTYSNIEKLILASASPRRRELLASLGAAFTVTAPEIDETPLENEKPLAFSTRMALEKANAVDTDEQTTVIAADTIVVLGETILGKPTKESHAFEMLNSLSGKTHQVITGVCVKRGEISHLLAVTTHVTFRTLTKGEIISYIATGCPMDKAGAYAIQGGAAHMVKSISGSYTNVVGLPLCELHEILISF